MELVTPPTPQLCAEITVQFEQDMYMVRESEGMVDIRVVASGRTSFDYMFTVTLMDITATSKLDGILCKYWICFLLYSLPLLCADNFDYTYSTATYSFGPTDDNEPIPSVAFAIPIIADDDKEFDKNFKLTIEVSDEARASNVTEGVISMTVVLIKDDDGKAKATTYYRILISVHIFGKLLQWRQ